MLCPTSVFLWSTPEGICECAVEGTTSAIAASVVNLLDSIVSLKQHTCSLIQTNLCDIRIKGETCSLLEKLCKADMVGHHSLCHVLTGNAMHTVEAP